MIIIFVYTGCYTVIQPPKSVNEDNLYKSNAGYETLNELKKINL